jgi:hypothetical protein
MVDLVVTMRFPGIAGIKCEAVVEFSCPVLNLTESQSFSNNRKIDFVNFA